MTTFIHKNIKALLLTILILLNVLVAALGNDMSNDPKRAAAGHRIEIRDFMFNPMTITVKSGETITWINRDDEPHTVVSVGKKFQKSPALDTDQEFTITAGAPGTYEFFCSVHPKMTGTIIVEK